MLPDSLIHEERLVGFLQTMAAASVVLSTGAWAQVTPDSPKTCASCTQWNQPQEPFRVFGNTYYVGTTELSSIIIRTSDGLILLDGALPQSAPLIDDNIRVLGFKTTDIRLILTSHAHYDHVGGVAALQRASGATVAASPKSAAALRQGMPTADDPQYAIADNRFPSVERVKGIEDGETLMVGDVRITAHFTPGHTPGSTSWTWRSCDGDRCANVVYADSLTPVSADEFRFTGSDTSPSLTGSFQRSIHAVRDLPCDILLTPHPGFVDMSTKWQRLREGHADAFIDPTACRSYASTADDALTRRIRSESTER